MADVAKAIFDRLDSLLRMLVPGLIGVYVLAVVGQRSIAAAAGSFGFLSLSTESARWEALFVASLVGLASYGLHLCVLEDLLMRVVLAYEWIRSRDADSSVSLRRWISHEHITIISRERWLRQTSASDGVRFIQAKLNHYASWLILAYCTGYILIADGLLLLAYDKTDLVEPRHSYSRVWAGFRVHHWNVRRCRGHTT